MIRSMYEPDHPSRARIANIISDTCGGRDLHRDAGVVLDLSNEDSETMNWFLAFLIKTKCIKKNRYSRNILFDWMRKNENTWADEWKEWSKDVYPVKDE